MTTPSCAELDVIASKPGAASHGPLCTVKTNGTSATVSTRYNGVSLQDLTTIVAQVPRRAAPCRRYLSSRAASGLNGIHAECPGLAAGAVAARTVLVGAARHPHLSKAHLNELTHEGPRQRLVYREMQ